MPAVSPREAIEKLIQVVERMDADDLLDFHIEEILDFWYVVFPGSRNVGYDENDQTIHYTKASEVVESTE